MLQDKQAGEEREEGGNRPGQIGQLKGQHRGNIRATQGQCSGASRDSLAADEGAEAACNIARSRGAALSSRDVASGAAGGFIGRQPVTDLSNRTEFFGLVFSLQDLSGQD